jgi:hypothetical protein
MFAMSSFIRGKEGIRKKENKGDKIMKVLKKGRKTVRNEDIK